jgi:threonine 3-dehydrogenase
VGEDVLITGAGPIGIMAAAVARHVGARHVVITDVNQTRLDLAARVADVTPVNVAREDLKEVQSRLKMAEGFDVGMEMSGNQQALDQMVDSLVMGGKIAMLGIPPGSSPVDWSKIVFKAITIKGVYGREIFETWYKMIAMLENGLDVSKVITHRFKAADFVQGFDVMRSGLSGKVVLDWT